MEIFCQIGKIVSKKISGLSKVLMQPPSWLSDSRDDTIVYDVCRGENKKSLPQGELQYDLTRIYPGTINDEFHKTAGHYHSEGYAELFEVLEGELITILENGGTEEEASEAYAVKASVGDSVIILPDFGFCSINPSLNKELVISNWIDTRARNVYEAIEKNHGLCYYMINTSSEEVSPVKNPAYQGTPELIWLKPKKLPQELESLEFLSSPNAYKEFLTIEKLYEKI